jgi:hypothetical protein
MDGVQKEQVVLELGSQFFWWIRRAAKKMGYEDYHDWLLVTIGDAIQKELGVQVYSLPDDVQAEIEAAEVAADRSPSEEDEEPIPPPKQISLSFSGLAWEKIEAAARQDGAEFPEDIENWIKTAAYTKASQPRV